MFMPGAGAAMDTALHVHLLIFLTTVRCYALNLVEDIVTQEYCSRPMRPYNVTCGVDQVLLVKGSRYGRMDIGQCVKRDLGYLGCAVDVSAIMDEKCSGRQQCSFLVPDQKLHDTKPCPDDTTAYLEMSYTCVTVSQLDRLSPPRCSESLPLVLKEPSGYISSSLTTRWDVGTQRCPWTVLVGQGQKIRLTKYNFNAPSVGAMDPLHAAGEAEMCFEYAHLREQRQLKKRVSLCRNEPRESYIYTSITNELQVAMVSAQVLENLAPFLLKYEAVGCPDIPPPVAGRVTRRGENVTITCDNGNEVWYLTCKGTQWQGQAGNCTKGGMSSSVFDQSSDFPFGILLVVAIGVALGVFLGGLLLILAVIYMKRKHRHQYGHEDFRQHADTLGPRPPPFPDHKTAMMINIHSEGSPHWDRVPKSLDSDDTGLGRSDPSCRTCALPYSQQQFIPLGPPPGLGDRVANVTGPADVSCGGGGDPLSRQHIYECPKFT